MPDDSLSYAAAGVDPARAGAALTSISDQIQSTHGPEVLAGLGSFGGVFRGTFAGDDPQIVASIDGVGTKTKVAAMAGDYSGIGADLVNHCVNDILCQGARPLFFLDYFGCSRLEDHVFAQVVGSAAAACRENGCALIGGETAEMPGVYVDGEVDVVGAIVGLVEGSRRLPRTGLGPGDRLIGIASSGLHTNGFSLARKALFERAGLSVNDPLPGGEGTLGQALLRPHLSYLRALEPLLADESQPILALAHITGGGLPDNLPRVLPSGLMARVEDGAWTEPPVFAAIQQAGDIPRAEMLKTFNMGVGMVLFVRQEDSSGCLSALSEAGVEAWEIGSLARGAREAVVG
jgi:phosphoribosylformylglycinamidine cyclo-ligase